MRKTFLGAGAALAIASTGAQAASWNIQPYADAPGASFTELVGVNDAGVLVGNTDTGGFVDDHGSRSAYTAVANSILTGISNSGVLVGDGPVGSFIDDHGTITDVTVPGAEETLARGISPNGRYVSGVYLTDTDSEGFILDRWTSTLTPILAPAGSSIFILQGINDAGVTVGNGVDNQAFVYDLATGVSTYYGSIDGLTHLRLRAINDVGEMGGWAIDPAMGTVGVIGTLPDDISTLSGLSTGWPVVYSLNGSGEAVGFTNGEDGLEHAFVATSLTAVPEPTSWALMLGGLGLAAMRLARPRRPEATAS